MQHPRKLLPVLAALVLIAGCAKRSEPEPDETKTEARADAKAEPAEPAEVLPDGAELLAASLEAAGGLAVIDAFESIHIVGTLEVKKHNLHGSSKLWWQKGGKVYVEQSIEGIGTSRFGYDGETAWVDDPITGLRELEGEEAASYLNTSMMFHGLEWPQRFAEAKTLSKAKLDDGEVWKIELVSKLGSNVTLGLDVDSKLIRTLETTQTTPMGDTPFEVRSDRYEEVEGYKFSMHQVSKIGGLLELDSTVSSFEVNVPIDEAMFGFPRTREAVPADPAEQPPIEAPAPD
jgi:hypothetical protein